MTASASGKSLIGRHGRAVVSVILIQMLLIVWLSLWAVEDYINNQYVRAYVDGILQAESWLFGAVVLVGLLGSVMGLFVRRNRHAEKTLGLMKKGPKLPMSSKVPSSSKIPTSTRVPASTPTVTSLSAAGQTVVSVKPPAELHPAVAALKAELSEARMSLGLASVATGTEKMPSPSPRFEDQRPMVGAQPSQTGQSPVMGPRPQPVTGPSPSTSIRPAQPPTVMRSPPPPTVIRPMAPPSPSMGSPTQTMPTLKAEGGPSPATQRPVGLLPRSHAVPGKAVDVSTVITGIVPAQQKKKESDSAGGQSSS